MNLTNILFEKRQHPEEMPLLVMKMLLVLLMIVVNFGSNGVCRDAAAAAPKAPPAPTFPVSRLESAAAGSDLPGVVWDI